MGDFYNRGGGALTTTTITATTITADDLEIDSGTLSIDETNNRVGVGLTTPKTALTVEGPVTLKEQASADGDTAAYGQVWVKTATPNELYFTTDAGDDVQITSGTSIVSASGAVSMANGSNNRITTATGAAALNGEANLTFDGTTLLVDSDVTATTNHTTVGAHIDYDATGIIASGQTGNNVGLDVDINSDSPTMVGTVVNTGLDIDLTGGTSGAQTNIGVDVNVTGADTNYAAVFNGGNVGIGTSTPSTALQIAAADAYITLKNTTAENGEGGAETRVSFVDHSDTALALIEGSHSGTADDTKGKLNLFTNTGSGVVPALTIDDTQLSTFAGDLIVSGGDATLGTAGNTTATTISTITNTGTTVGKSLTIAAGSTTTGANNLNGGDLILKSGDGDGNGTSSMQFHTKVSGTDAAAERMRINTNGNVVINGSTAHAASLALDGATAAVALKEMSNAPADTAAFGQLWVKTATPNQLYFTTDAGDDIQLTSGTSTAGGGGSVTANDASLILATRVFS